jgi:hypothetical protein
MTNVKANDYDILDDDAILLLNGSGVFALSNGEAIEAVTYDLRLALTQTEFQYVDAFPKPGGGKMISAKRVGQIIDGNHLINQWTSKF